MADQALGGATHPSATMTEHDGAPGRAPLTDWAGAWGMRLKASFRSPLRTPLLAGGIGLLASAIVAFEVGQVARAKDEERFEHVVAQTQDSIQARLETYVAMLRAGAGLLEANDGVLDRRTFRTFVAELELDQHYPGIQGIGFSARLPGDSIAAAERALSRYGASGLRIYPSRPREEYHAIVHLEPLDTRNEAALGYDMFSEPVRYEAMSRARDTGEPAASGKVELVQEIDHAKQAGFLIYLPVYGGDDIPSSEAERRQRLRGFVYSPFRAEDLMQGIFGSAPRPRVHFDIYDGEVHPANLLHSSPGVRSERPRMTATRQLEVAGRQWTVLYETRPEFELGSSRMFAPWVFLGGLIATALLVFLAWRQARATEDADRAARASSGAARRLQILNASAAKLAGELDREHLLQSITDAGRDLCGAEIGAFFYNVRDEAGEAYMLYALSGAPREAFASMGMPRNTAVFGPTFRGEAIVRSADITADARFGQNAPHRGFPPGHWPVRSYLAAPVRSRSGEVVGGLFFGHSQTGKFDEDVERALEALTGHAAIALDNAALFQAAQEEIASRRRAEDQQKLLVDELNHRVKNTLATVQSIAAQTLRTAATPEEFRAAFEKRLIALSQTHNILAHSSWRGADLRRLIQRELAPHGLEDDGRTALQGEDVWLPPSTALALGLTVHELATNAARHGALSRSGGKVSVSWRLTPTEEERAVLQLVWQESGGPEVRPPSRRGFGSRLIERGLAHEGASSRLEFRPDGLRCEIEMPVPAQAHARATAAAS